MLILGIVLIVIGAILALFGRREGEPLAFWGGVIIFAGGVLLFVIAILNRSGADTAAAVTVADLLRSSWGVISWPTF